MPNAHRRKHEHHGMSRSPTYKSWDQMIQRCTNPKSLNFHYYGGAGVTVCDEWKDSFAAFYAYLGERPTLGHSIDRIEGARGYERGNVRWATRQQQSGNRSVTRFLTFKGEAHSMTEWARRAGIQKGTFHDRISRLGWSVERAISEPVHPKRASPSQEPA